MLTEYRKHEEERRSLGIPPLALNAEQVSDLVELIKKPPAGEEELILDLFTNRIPAGVDQAAYVKAAFLADVAKDFNTKLLSGMAIPILKKKQSGTGLKP